MLLFPIAALSVRFVHSHVQESAPSANKLRASVAVKQELSVKREQQASAPHASGRYGLHTLAQPTLICFAHYWSAFFFAALIVCFVHSHMLTSTYAASQANKLGAFVAVKQELPVKRVRQTYAVHALGQQVHGSGNIDFGTHSAAI